MAQTLHDWEHLVCADGADDRVRRLVEEIDDPRVKYLHTSHRFNDMGNTPRNHALNLASGLLVVGLDDDNEILPTYLAEMAAAFDSDEVGYCICWVDFRSSIDPGKRRILKPRYPFERGKIDCLNFMVRTELSRQVGGWQPGNTGSNWDVYAAEFYLIDKISRLSGGRYVEKVLGRHRAAPGSVRRYCARRTKGLAMRVLGGMALSAARRLIRRSLR